MRVQGFARRAAAVAALSVVAGSTVCELHVVDDAAMAPLLQQGERTAWTSDVCLIDKLAGLLWPLEHGDLAHFRCAPWACPWLAVLERSGLAACVFGA